jgi:arabinofuranosyltransferase
VPRRLESWLILAGPFVVVIVGAWSYRWVQEDAFIDFRIIGNLLAGHGPVYNVGERVEVYSDPAWLYLQAGLHLLLPFVSVEWISVISGLISTSGGVILCGRAVQRLGASRGEGLVIPVGLVIFASVAAVWEFATSGLEMGLVFLWIGLTFWLLVRSEIQRSSSFWCALVIGLGPLIRPELVVMAVVFLVTLGLVIASPGWSSPRRLWVRELAALGTFASIPIAYETFRMAYFAMVVPNTALAKSFGSSWWSQGFTYLWNFVAPYTLWLPMALGAVVMVPCLWRWWKSKDRIGVAVAISPMVAGFLDIAYTVEVGGDYMHARLLLPGFCGLCTGIFVGTRHFRSFLVLPLAVIAIWGLASVGWLRAPTNEWTAQPIDNERSFWIQYSGRAHPIVPNDLRRVFTYKWSTRVDTIASNMPRDRKFLFAGTLTELGPARSEVPFEIATDASVVGLIGVLTGPRVYIFDLNSLANPIGSHTESQRSRSGKTISQIWMIARFGVPEHGQSKVVASDTSVSAARRALSCQPLSGYLRAITGSLRFGQAISNIEHSFTYTTMTFSSDPSRAEHQLCR